MGHHDDALIRPVADNLLQSQAHTGRKVDGGFSAGGLSEGLVRHSLSNACHLALPESCGSFEGPKVVLTQFLVRLNWKVQTRTYYFGCLYGATLVTRMKCADR